MVFKAGSPHADFTTLVEFPALIFIGACAYPLKYCWSAKKSQPMLKKLAAKSETLGDLFVDRDIMLTLCAHQEIFYVWPIKLNKLLNKPN